MLQTKAFSIDSIYVPIKRRQTLDSEKVRRLPWAVQVALSRPGRRRLSGWDISEIKRCTRDPQTLRWPAGTLHEQGD